MEYVVFIKLIKESGAPCEVHDSLCEVVDLHKITDARMHHFG